MKRVNFLIPVFLLVLGLLTSCGSTEPKEKEVVRYVKTAEVLPVSGNSTLIYNGVVKENRQVTLSFKVAGPIVELTVDAGDYVNKGQVLARIDKRDYNVNVQASEARYTQSKAEYERYKELYERKKLPENTLEKLKAGYLMAKSQYEAAVNALEDTDLKAPFAGYVNKKMIENFQTVGAGQPIIELLDFSDLEVVVSIPEGQINEMNEVAKITCDIKNANQFAIPGIVKSLSKKTGSDHMFEAKILLKGENLKQVKPGMVAKVNVLKDELDNSGLLVPVEAVFSQSEKKYIWVVDQDMTVQKHEVTVIKIQQNGLIELKNHVQVGSKVVIAGVHSLVEGQKVQILPEISETNIGGLL
jgi:RND family efflux transporter MFP subunit